MGRLTVLTCATEAGGATNLVPIVQRFSGVADFQVYCDRGGRVIFERAGITTHSCELVTNEIAASEFLATVGPNVVLVGRGIDLDSSERHFTSSARRLNIPTIGITDEWYDYRDNYVNELGQLSHLPTIVCCPDDQARDEAIMDGLPSDILRVTGSPGLSALIDKRELYTRYPPTRPLSISKKSRHPIVIFISESINVIRSIADEPDQFDHARGPASFDEYRVRDELAHTLQAQFGSCTVLERLHPSACVEAYSPIELPGVSWKIDYDSDLHSLYWWADAVVGMRSAGLLESVLLGTPTVSYQPGLTDKNRCTAVRKGLISCCLNLGELALWLDRNAGVSEKNFLKRPDYAGENATDTVFSIVEHFALTSPI